MNFRKLRVRVGELKFHWRRDFGPAAPDFGKCVFKPVRHVDSHPVFGTGYRIKDGLSPTFSHAFDNDVAASRGNIGFEVDRRENRFVQLFERRGEYTRSEERRVGKECRL